MSSMLASRLNEILPRITSEAFLSSEGIGNEIACYIFDYPAEDELQVREHLQMILDRLASHHSSLSVLHLNMLDVVLAYLERRGLLDRALQMQAKKGDAGVLKALQGPLAPERLRDFIDAEHRPAEHDLFLISGMGSAWPMVHAHALLNCLHRIVGRTPLVMFYPGSFDGTTLKLFGRIESATATPRVKSYYRAFSLVPGGTTA